MSGKMIDYTFKKGCRFIHLGKLSLVYIHTITIHLKETKQSKLKKRI